jgi:hypothetical protein
MPYQSETQQSTSLNDLPDSTTQFPPSATSPDSIFQQDPWELVLQERRRQVEAEGFDHAHDDKHCRSELALAAACYSAPFPIFQLIRNRDDFIFTDPWPWTRSWDKRPRNPGTSHPNHIKLLPPGGLLNIDQTPPEDRMRCLAKAGALILAEMERLKRLNS